MRIRIRIRVNRFRVSPVRVRIRVRIRVMVMVRAYRGVRLGLGLACDSTWAEKTIGMWMMKTGGCHSLYNRTGCFICRSQA